MRIRQLDGLRALAVLLVVVSHSGFTFIPGGLGVTIFFAISGFVITRLLIFELEETGTFSAKNFFTRRFLKIYPPLLGIVILPTLITWNSGSYDFRAVAFQLFALYNWLPATGQTLIVLPGSEVVWSLAIEEQFYLIMAFLWFRIVRSDTPIIRLQKALVSAWIFSTVLRIIIYVTPDLFSSASDITSRIYFGTETRLSTIAGGCLLATTWHHSWVRKLREKNAPSLFLGIIILLTSLLLRSDFFRDSIRFTVQEIGVLLVIVAITGPMPFKLKFVEKILLSRIIQSIGKASYSIYLVHFSVILWVANQRPIVDFASHSLLATFAVGAGCLCHQIFDKPTENLRKKYR